MKKNQKVISFRTFKKNCKHEDYTECQEIEWHKTENQKKCCEKNCPKFKRLKDLKKVKNDEFYMAICLSLTIVYGVYGEDTIAYEILKDVGICLDDLIKYCKRVGAEYDLKNLERLSPNMPCEE